MDSNGQGLEIGQPTERTCLICGCTEEKGCEGVCGWIQVDYDKDTDICSKCITKRVPECLDLLVQLISDTHRQHRNLCNARLMQGRPCLTCDLIDFARKVEAALRQ